MPTAKVVIATNNKNKTKEILGILSDITIKFLTLKDINFKGEIIETGKTFKENAVIKAKKIANFSKLATLAEDSGLVVDALGGSPGIYSARYQHGSDLDRINKVLRELKKTKSSDRTARFITVAVLYDPKSDKLWTFEGQTEGSITEKPKGSKGFGYDPIFYSFELQKTFGQATADEKNSVSHRAVAFKKCLPILKLFTASAHTNGD